MAQLQERSDFRALDRQLQQLPGKLARKVGRRAMNKGAAVIQKDARPRIPVDKRLGAKGERRGGRPSLRRALARRVKHYPKSGTIIAVIGPKAAAKAYHAHLVEKGTVARQHKKKKKDGGTHRTGTMPAYHWLRDAYETKQQQARNVIATELSRGVGKEALEVTQGAKALTVKWDINA